ncbi:MAG: hypothetical protein RL721_151 [Candidatus Eisenbacteria bacterium]
MRPRSILRALVAVFALACAAVVPAVAAPEAGLAGLRLAPATPGAVRFSVTVPEPRLVRVDREQQHDDLVLEGFAAVGVPGRPALPTRVVLVAVPPLGEVRLTAVASELRVREGVTLAPQTHVDRDGQVVRVPRDLASYGAEGDPTPVAARLLEVTWMRNQRVARVELSPVAYEPAARRLGVAARLDVELAVTPSGPLGPPAEPTDGFEPIYRRTLVNYEQGRAWRRPRTEAFVAAARRMGMPAAVLAAEAVQVETTSVFAGRTWIKMAIQRSGFYAVNYSRLRNLSLFDPLVPAPLDSLRLFTWPGVTVLPENSYCDSCGFREVALGIVRDVSAPPSGQPNVDGPADGFFADNNDAFYFYAQGPDGWEDEQDPSRPDTSWTTNPYDRNNYYYLTVATGEKPVAGGSYPFPPQRIGAGGSTVRDVTPNGTETPVVTVPGRVHLEQDLEYWPDATAVGTTYKWEKWFWRSLISGQTFTHSLDLPDADVSQPARFRLRQWGLSDNYRSFTSSCFGDTPDHFLDVRVNDVVFPRYGWFSNTALDGGVLTLDTTTVFLRTAGNQLTISVPTVPRDPLCANRLDRSGVAFYEVYYERRLLPQQDAIEFRTRATAGRFRYEVGPFVKEPSTYLFDVTDPQRPVLLTGATRTAVPGGGWTLSFADTQTGSRRYAVVTDSTLTQTTALLASTALADAPFTSRQNLRSTTNQADYLVIHYDGFQQAADSLVAWRRLHLPLLTTPAPHEAIAIPVSAIFDQFSGGRTDPGALRNFLRAAANWSRRPLYVTFLGDASYDFKDITGRATPGQPGCLLPTYENGFDNIFVIRRQYATDDWIVNVNDPVRVLPDFLSGRIPAGDPASALAIVTQKILGYERSAPFGEYRNSVVLMADDNVQGGPCDQTTCQTGCDPLAWTHVIQTDNLNQSHTPSHIDRQYVYLHTYATGPGVTKPGARTDLFAKLNQGTSVFNYVGHGSPFKMTDEGVFLDSDAGTLVNGLKMSLMVAASCDVGKFSDPTVQSLGERIFMSPTGGCIAVLSATEQALSSDNSLLNGLIYDALFDRDSLRVGGILLPTQGQYHVPISAALLAAKSVPAAQSQNSQKYQLMGDPATLLNLPRLWADLTLTDLQGAPLDTLARGQTVLFEGEVLDRPGGVRVPVDGVASVLIEDSAPLDRTDGTCQFPADYTFKAGTIYHGDVTLTAGTFKGRFVVPLDAVTGDAGRIRAYLNGRPVATAAPVDGVGDRISSVAPGTPPAGDEEGPRITLSFQGGSTNVRPDATLQILLFDESGIMTTGHAPQNSIIVTLDENTTSRTDITASFRYAADSYQSGSASFTLPDLAPGSHTIRVSAADNLATGLTAARHRSSATLEFQVVDVPPLRIVRTYLFPNPVTSGGGRSGGVFVVDAPGDSVNTLIRIYTVAGKLVRELRQAGGIGQVQMVWDGLDAEGSPLAQGTYLYKVHVSGRDADGRSNPRQRTAAEGRFVVLSP